MEICMNWFAHVTRFYLCACVSLSLSALVVQRREIGNSGSKEG